MDNDRRVTWHSLFSRHPFHTYAYCSVSLLDLLFIGEENIHRGLSGAAYRNKCGRRMDSFQYLNNITTVLAAAISYSS